MSEGTLFVTGASGFTGRHLIAAARHHGFRCVALCRDSDSLCESADENIVAPLSNPDLISAAMEKTRPDFVIHLAAIAYVAHGSAREIYETNLIGTINLLDAVQKQHTTPRRIVLASSANVYGESEELPITEETPLNPVNHYALSKVAMERASQQYTQLPITISRPFNYTGVGQSAWFLVPKLVHAFRQRCSEIKLGDVSVERDFSDVRDVAIAYLALLRAPLGTYNIASGKMYSVKDVIDILHELTGHSITIEKDPKLFRASEIMKSCGARNALEKATNLEPQFSLTETLDWMLTS